MFRKFLKNPDAYAEPARVELDNDDIIHDPHGFVTPTRYKTCCMCQKRLPLTAFHKAKNFVNNKYNRVNRCKTCATEYNLMYRYHITPAEYNQMWIIQDGKCAICGQPETAKQNGTIKLLAVDHNHVTGENRSLLCTKCNVAIGCLLEDNDRLQKCMTYLSAHNST